MNRGHGLEVAERAEGSNIVLVVAGDVDMASAPALAQAVGEALRRRPPLLVFDLTAINFLSTAGMSILLQADERGREAGIACRMVVDQSLVRRPMELLGLDEILDFHRTVDDALHAGTNDAP